MTTLENLVAAMTVGELARFANQSVEQVVQAVLEGRPATQRAGKSSRDAENGSRRSAGDKSAGKRSRGSITDEEVLAVIASAKGPIKAEEVRATVGGSAAQIRNALHRLRDAKVIRVQGERRGTRYSAR